MKQGAWSTADLSRILQADLYRYYERTDWRTYISAYLRQPGFRFSHYLRKVAFYRSRNKRLETPSYLFSLIMLNRYRFKYGFDISPSAEIGPGLYLGHFGCVVISPYAVLGANVNIGHGATIGAESRGKRTGAPTLGDRVWVGNHAIIVGKIKIGNQALIAPGAFVNFDVPARAVVLGNPGKIVSDTGSDGYINRVLSHESPV